MTEAEKQMDRNTATSSVKLILALGYDIVPSRGTRRSKRPQLRSTVVAVTNANRMRAKPVQGSPVAAAATDASTAGAPPT